MSLLNVPAKVTVQDVSVSRPILTVHLSVLASATLTLIDYYYIVMAM